MCFVGSKPIRFRSSNDASCQAPLENVSFIQAVEVKFRTGWSIEQFREQVYRLGGNRLEEVRELAYPLNEVIGYRWPDAA